MNKILINQFFLKIKDIYILRNINIIEHDNTIRYNNTYISKIFNLFRLDIIKLLYYDDIQEGVIEKSFKLLYGKISKTKKKFKMRKHIIQQKDLKWFHNTKYKKYLDHMKDFDIMIQINKKICHDCNQSNN